jgi:hypothetical protein
MGQIHKKLEELKKRLLQDGNGNKCFLPECSEVAIRSHTLSKIRVLQLLEGKDERGNVVLFHLDDQACVDYKTLELSSFHESNRSLNSNGKMDSSVFYGFCSTHDRSIFDRLDNYVFSPDKESCFLHSFRAFSYYLTKKKELISTQIDDLITQVPVLKDSVESIPGTMSQITAIFDKIPDSYEFSKVEYQVMVDALKKQYDLNPVRSQLVPENELLASLFAENEFPMSASTLKNKLKAFTSKNIDVPLKELAPKYDQLVPIVAAANIENNDLMMQLIDLYRSKDFEKLNYLTYSLDGVFLAAGSFCFALSNSVEFSLTFFPEKETNKTHFIFGTLNNTSEGNLMFSRINIMSITEFKQYVSFLILTKGSNVFFSPDYIVKLSKEEKDSLTTKRNVNNKPKMYFNLFDDSYNNLKIGQ